MLVPRSSLAVSGTKPLIIEAPDNICGYVDGLESECIVSFTSFRRYTDSQLKMLPMAV